MAKNNTTDTSKESKTGKATQIFPQTYGLIPISRSSTRSSIILQQQPGDRLIQLTGIALQVVVHNSADYSISRAFGNNLLFQSFGATPSVVVITGIQAFSKLACYEQSTDWLYSPGQLYDQLGIHKAQNKNARLQVVVQQNARISTTYTCILVDLQQQFSSQQQSNFGPVTQTYKLTLIGVPKK